MKTRIILKSFDALSFDVFLSASSSDQIGGAGSSGQKPSPASQTPAASVQTDFNCGDRANARPKGAVWAGLAALGCQPAAH